MLKCLEQRNFPLGELTLLASERSAGRKLAFRDQEIEVQELGHDSFKGVDIALFSAGGSLSLEFGPSAAAAGAVVIDNSSAFRMDPEVPLVVPEVNPDAAKSRPKGIIANPNCTTAIALMARRGGEAARGRRDVGAEPRHGDRGVRRDGGDDAAVGSS